MDIYGPATRVDNIDDFEWEMKNEEVCYDQKSLFALKWPKLPMHASDKHKWIRKMCTTIQSVDKTEENYLVRWISVVDKWKEDPMK